MNEEKSKALIFKKGNDVRREVKEIEEIEGIEVVRSIKYLGIEINDKADMFESQREVMMEKAQRMAKNTYAVIEKSCNKVLMGKTFWKGVALPHILMGNQVVVFNQEEVESLQVIENGVYRKILGGTRDTVLETLRGEIGSSLMSSRIMENKILFMKNMQEGENELMKEIVRNMKEDKDNKWMSGVDKYLRKLGMNREDIGRMDKNEIKRRIKEYDSNIWKSKLMGKKKAKRYFENKYVMKEERIYDNRFSSVLLFRARTNVLGLNDRQRWKKGDTSCRLCGYEYEDLEHFLLDCKKLEGGRNKELIERKMVNGEDTVGKLLFDFADGDLEELKRMLQEMWSIR